MHLLRKINFYKVNPNDTGIHKLAELVLQGTQETKKMVLEFAQYEEHQRDDRCDDQN